MIGRFAVVHAQFSSDPKVVAELDGDPLIAQGSADNLFVRTTIHTTVNANGQITATSFEFEVECQG